MGYVIKTEVDINASPETVWDVLVDFPRYGEWSNPCRRNGPGGQQALDEDARLLLQAHRHGH
ncbi:SRPBCC family protein [Streptomyces sp. NPDC017435]|uniref:SRPBCC family protein n=1 Tax=Streptomyces sp. NPDC017435 TaxID=3364995 RepID=UPI0037A85C84